MRTFQRMTQQERALEIRANTLLGIRPKRRGIDPKRAAVILGEPETTLSAEEREANRLWLQAQIQH